MKTLLRLAPLFLILASCATVQTVDPELRRRAAGISVLTADEVGDRQYEIIGEVLGLSCARQTGSDPSREGAEQDMRVEAAKQDADAVINAFCEEGGLNMKRNCWKTFQCRGDAVRWK